MKLSVLNIDGYGGFYTLILKIVDEGNVNFQRLGKMPRLLFGDKLDIQQATSSVWFLMVIISFY